MSISDSQQVMKMKNLARWRMHHPSHLLDLSCFLCGTLDLSCQNMKRIQSSFGLSGRLNSVQTALYYHSRDYHNPQQNSSSRQGSSSRLYLLIFIRESLGSMEDRTSFFFPVVVPEQPLASELNPQPFVNGANTHVVPMLVRFIQQFSLL